MFITVLPNCLAPIIVQAALSFSTAILDAAALGFLGMGAQPPTPEWGTMLADARGSQVSFRFDNGYAAIQALIARGVVGDFRAPDIMRFGFTPLYIDIDDVRRAVEIIAEVMHGRLWARPEYSRKAGVT